MIAVLLIICCTITYDILDTNVYMLMSTMEYLQIYFNNNVYTIVLVG